jgi:uncharacterized phage protein gp47/JayE
LNFPTHEDIIQVLVDNLIGEGKRLDDLPNQGFSKHLILAISLAIYGMVVVAKSVYDQLTTLGAKGEKLKEKGYEYGVEPKEATYAVHTVTVWKSSPVDVDTPIPDDFLFTTMPLNDNPPIQFRVIPGQNKFIAAGQNSVTGVKVKCTEPGEIGNVPPGEIKLVAQAGFDYVTDSVVVEYGADEEDEESFRQRILDRKRNPERGGVEMDYKIWAESVDGVASALVLPLNRGNGTVDIVISGYDGPPGPDLVARCQEFIDTKTPADIADGGVLVLAPTSVPIDITMSQCVWRQGYTTDTGGPHITAALQEYIRKKVNTDRVSRVYDIISVAKQAHDPADPDKNPLLLDFVLDEPVTNRPLVSTEMAVPGEITLS